MKLRLFRNIVTGHLLLMCTVAILGGSANAANSKASGSPYKQEGKVDNVILKHNQIVIGDRAYVFANNITIWSGNRVASKAALAKGMRLGFNITTDKSRSIISEIWILPSR